MRSRWNNLKIGRKLQVLLAAGRGLSPMAEQLQTLVGQSPV